MCTISIIVARSKNNIIGNNNLLPWKLPSDLKHFKSITQNSVVIMGRKTYESIGKPLPNRLNVVVSTQKNLSLPNNVTVCNDPNEALKASRVLCLKHNIQNIWIIGGAAIYQQFIKRADKMVITTIDEECEGDTTFPVYKSDFWKLTDCVDHYDVEGYMMDNPMQIGLKYKIEEFERIF